MSYNLEILGKIFKNRLTGTYYRCCGFCQNVLALQQIDKRGKLTTKRIWVGLTKLLYKLEPDLVCPLYGTLKTWKEAEELREKEEEKECC